ncbi:MAG: GH116 family glycosyl hydrolase, partial [Candidatus Margulisbacteria bacterium]|nr:GH116 family glycosyl hydrolase [Candidatus Margulisiibacteriota bacterium]
MISKSAWSRPVKDWINIKPKGHRAEFPMINTFPHGVPIGGFGTGTIGISPEGKWNCLHLEPGKHVFNNKIKPAFIFSYSFDKKFQELDYQSAVYTALYPQARWDLKVEQKIKISLLQYSPVIMEDYEYSSYPAGLFKITTENNEKKPVTIKIRFNLQDILDRNYERVNKGNSFLYKLCPSKIPIKLQTTDYGVELYKKTSRQKDAIGIYCSEKVYTKLSQNNSTQVSFTVNLAPGQQKTLDFIVAWDIPSLYFSDNQILRKKYTEFFPELNRLQLLMEKLIHDKESILEKIAAWQEKVRNLPFSDEIITLMINELYYLAHGGTLWEANTNRFGYLECIDYPFYETLDVRYYSSWALLYGWPELELQVIKQFADSINLEDKTIIKFNTSFIAHKALHDNQSETELHEKLGYRKIKGACPHDLGSFEENPFLKTNSYCYQNPNYWKDLNPKFILMVYRNFHFTKDRTFLDYCWPAVLNAYEYFKRFDIDGDGLPENGGWPDQTYDNWTMQGSSAYCSILWLAAVTAFKKMAEILGKSPHDSTELLNRGLLSLEKKLWNKNYYKYDETLDDVMSDQLAGQWFLSLCGLPQLIESSRVESVLDYVYKHNYSGFSGRLNGMVNGRTVAGKEVFTPQGNDVWLGVNYGLCSYYLFLKQKSKAKSLLDCIYNSLYRKGFYFRSPESLDKKGRYIAQMYMRPQA